MYYFRLTVKIVRIELRGSVGEYRKIERRFIKERKSFFDIIALHKTSSPRFDGFARAPLDSAVSIFTETTLSFRNRFPAGELVYYQLVRGETIRRAISS